MRFVRVRPIDGQMRAHASSALDRFADAVLLEVRDFSLSRCCSGSGNIRGPRCVSL